MKPAILGKLVARIESLSQRDRVVMLAGVLALLAAVEFQLVLGLRERRLGAEAAQLQQPATDQAQIEAAAKAERQARLKDIKHKLEQRQAELAQQGLASPPQAIFDALRKTIALSGVQVLALRALPDKGDEEQPETPSATPTAATALAVAASAAAAQVAQAAAPAAQPASAPEHLIYRHRTELRIAGPLGEVTRIVQSFEQPKLPLRLERVSFKAADNPALVEASVVLLTIGQDRTWLAL